MRIRVVGLGGGTGLSSVAKALSLLREKVVQTHGVASTDNGRSTGEFVHNYNGFGYLGDLRNVGVNMSCEPEIEWINDRLPSTGQYKDLSLGNAAFHGIFQRYGLERGLEIIWGKKNLNLGDNRVFPVTAERTTLYAQVGNGHPEGEKCLEGEYEISEFFHSRDYDPVSHRVKKIYIHPMVDAYAPLVEAIGEADRVIVGPGSLFTSTIASLQPKGISKAIRNSSATLVLIPNLMEVEWESRGFHVEDYLEWIETTIGRKCDVILLSIRDKVIPRDMSKNYRWEHKRRVVPRDNDLMDDPRVFARPMLGFDKDNTIIHDPQLLADALIEVFEGSTTDLMAKAAIL